MTMLTFRYNGIGAGKEDDKPVAEENVLRSANGDIVIYNNFATKENYQCFSQWLNSVISDWGVSEDTANKLQLISEELYTNIFSYAYPHKEGAVEIAFKKEENSIICIFRDWGIPYNPLERPDPDVTLPPETRDIGGLGIYIVKNTVDEISYEYRENSNILKMTIFL